VHIAVIKPRKKEKLILDGIGWGREERETERNDFGSSRATQTKS